MRKPHRDHLKANGLAERGNRIVLEVVRTVLASAEQPAALWAELANAAVYLCNRVVTRVLNYKIPYRGLYGRLPNYSRLRSLMARGRLHVRAEERRKIDPTSREVFLVGYEGNN